MIELQLLDKEYNTYRFVTFTEEEVIQQSNGFSVDDKKYENTELTLYLNKTFQIQHAVSHNNCVLMYNGEMYQICPSLGKFTVDLVRRPNEIEENEYEYSFIKISHLMDTRTFDEAIQFIDDDGRKLVTKTIDKAIEHLNEFNRDKNTQIFHELEFSFQDWNMVHLRTSMKHFDLDEDMTPFRIGGIEVKEIIRGMKGIDLLLDTSETRKKIGESKWKNNMPYKNYN